MSLPPTPTMGAPDRIAILYVPGIHHDDPENELEIVGRKLARSLDQHAADGRPVFFSETGPLPLGSRTRTGCRLVRRDGAAGAETAVADLFKLDYRDSLLGPLRRSNPLARVATVAAALSVMVLAAGWRWFRPGVAGRLRTPAQRGHVAYALALLFCVVLYLLLLVGSGLKVLAGIGAQGRVPAPPPAGVSNRVDRPPPVTAGGMSLDAGAAPGATSAPGEPAGPDPELPDGWSGVGVLFAPFDWLWTWVTASDGRFFVVLTGAALLIGPHLRSRITRGAEEAVALGLYFGLGLRRPQLLGAFDDWVENLVGQGGYTRCIVIGYSFGSILALDALFPPCARRAARLAAVDTLVTIGSPHDLVLTYWPAYFDGRSERHAPPRSWLNVYLPADVLSSRFQRETPPSDDPTPAPGLPHRPTGEAAFLEVRADERLGVLGWLSLLGLRAHAMYWSEADEHERSCFDLVVADVFPELCGRSRARAGGAAPGPATSLTSSS